METKNKLKLLSPPTFSQMMEDLEITSSENKTFKFSQLEELTKQTETSGIEGE